MTTLNKGTKKIGTCEVCDKENIEVVNTPGNIEMCSDCKADDDKIRQQTKSVDNILNHAKQVDSRIELKQDIFNANTVPAIQLKAAIDNDESIPADQKDYAFTKECYERMIQLDKAIWQKKEELKEDENQRRFWQTQVQSMAGKLRAEYREHFKNLNMNYQPAPVKVVKSTTKTKSVKKKATMKECIEAAQKYNLAGKAGTIQMMTYTRNISAEEAAKILVETFK